MRILNWRVGLGLFWLMMSAMLFFRESFWPEELLAQYRGRNLNFGAWMGLILAGWNFSRWYMGESIRWQRSLRQQQPIRPQRSGEAGYEYIPEFDFQKMERAGEDTHSQAPQPPAGESGGSPKTSTEN